MKNKIKPGLAVLLQADTCCHYKPWDPAANCTSLVRIPYRNEVALEQAVATVGPVSVGVDAKSFAFRFYKSGKMTFRAAYSLRTGHDCLSNRVGFSVGGTTVV